ncbi:aldehyde dehydrogenase family protein [Sphingobacterium sp.]|uniref:aldehyde dehydrogenase family protein n=1 Tax=Sphingobacterium sp. TaxID=341027 RepID=UPI0031E0774C
MSQIAQDTQIDVSELFQKLKKSQSKYKRTTIEERINTLRKLQMAIVSHKDEVLDALFADFGKPHYESLTSEILSPLNEIEDACKNLSEWAKSTEVSPQVFKDAKTEIIYEPKGTVLIIGPWNFPFYLSISPLIPAIAAGNNVVLKPSEITPHVSAVIKKIIEATFEDDYVTVVEGSVSITTELLKLAFDHIFFTGSPKVGKIVMEAAAKNLTSVTLELGGKSPTIVDETADLDKAVVRIIRGKAINAGQICLAPDYLLIPKELQDAFIEKTESFMKEWFFKDGKWDYTDLSQIVNEANFHRLKGLFDDAVAKGATVAYGGIFNETLRKIHPTILTNVPLDAKIMQEEIFGPLLPVFNYENLEDVIAFVNQFDKPLAYYVFSQNQENIDFLIKNSTSGGVTTNDIMLHCAEISLPFGGVNTSGIGKYHGVFGFLELSNARGILYQPFESEALVLDPPPYTGKVEAVTKAFFSQPE